MFNTMTPPSFGAIFRNELAKNWARRGRALIIALIILIAGAGLFSWHTYHQFENSQQNTQQAVAQARKQLAQMQHQLTIAPASKRAALREAVMQQATMVQQMQEDNGGVLNERSQVKSLSSTLATLPTSQRGQTEEQLALARYRADHGQAFYNPAADSGWRLVGLIFSGQAVVLFALLAVLIASDAVSAELQSGTWGILLLHAPRRIQLYLGKWAAALATVWMFMVVAAVGIFIFGSALMGIGNPMAPHVLGPRLLTVSLPQDGPVPSVILAAQTFHLVPQWSYDLLALGLAVLTVGGLVTLLIALSVVTRSTVWSLILGVLVVISSLAIAALGKISALDPAVFFPLMSSWTGIMALQDNNAFLNIQTGLLVTAFWAAAALIAGMWRINYTDV